MQFGVSLCVCLAAHHFHLSEGVITGVSVADVFHLHDDLVISLGPTCVLRKGQVIGCRTRIIRHVGGGQESRACADRHYLRRTGGQTCQLPSPLVVSNQGSRTRTAGYQQNSPRTDIFGSYSFDPDTALIDFHARPVKREKQHPGAISIDEYLKGAKDIQGFKPVEYDNYDNIDIY